MTHKPKFVAGLDNRWYCVVNDCDKSTAADVPADVVDKCDDIFAQEAFWEVDGGTSFPAGVQLVNATGLTPLFKQFPDLYSELADLEKGFLDEQDASQEATARA